MNEFRPILDRMVLAVARIGGKLLGRPSDALLTSLASRARRPAPTTVNVPPVVKAAEHIQQGQAAFNNGAYGEALHHFGVAIKHAPNAAWAWHGRGDALQLSGQYKAAYDAYKTATTIDDACGLHHAGMANALTSMGKNEPAQQAWDKALSRDPSLTWMRDGSKKT